MIRVQLNVNSYWQLHTFSNQKISVFFSNSLLIMNKVSIIPNYSSKCVAFRKFWKISHEITNDPKTRNMPTYFNRKFSLNVTQTLITYFANYHVTGYSFQNIILVCCYYSISKKVTKNTAGMRLNTIKYLGGMRQKECISMSISNKLNRTVHVL